jgi:hypothetical protein
VALTETIKIQRECKRDVDPEFSPDDVQILSIGTGQPRYSLNPPGASAGVIWWVPKLFEVMSMSQSQGVDCELKYILGDRYRRINFDVPDSSWTLDSVQHLGALIHYGRKVAHNHLAELVGNHFSEERPGYLPFDDVGSSESVTLVAAGAC